MGQFTTLEIYFRILNCLATPRPMGTITLVLFLFLLLPSVSLVRPSKIAYLQKVPMGLGFGQPVRKKYFSNKVFNSSENTIHIKILTFIEIGITFL